MDSYVRAQTIVDSSGSVESEVEGGIWMSPATTRSRNVGGYICTYSSSLESIFWKAHRFSKF